jgi:hypothetical protein
VSEFTYAAVPAISFGTKLPQDRDMRRRPAGDLPLACLMIRVRQTPGRICRRHPVPPRLHGCGVRRSGSSTPRLAGHRLAAQYRPTTGKHGQATSANSRIPLSGDHIHASPIYVASPSRMRAY